MYWPTSTDKVKKACLKLVPYLVVLLLTSIFFRTIMMVTILSMKNIDAFGFEDGEMAGNNRTSQAFDYAYDRYLKSDRVLRVWDVM